MITRIVEVNLNGFSSSNVVTTDVGDLAALNISGGKDDRVTLYATQAELVALADAIYAAISPTKEGWKLDVETDIADAELLANGIDIDAEVKGGA